MKRWRLIEYDTFGASYNMSLDEAISSDVNNDISPATLRFYGWSSKAVSIGLFQKMSEIDIELCRERSISVVRRPTGGRAILHDRELTYSFSSGQAKEFFSDSVLENYILLSRAFAMAFNTLGINAVISEKRLKRESLSGSPICFEAASYSELTVEGRKIVGSAQKRYTNGFLQQGAIPFLIDRELTSRVFKVTGSLDTMTAVNDINKSITINDLIAALTEAFEKSFHISFATESPSDRELDEALKLENKYRSDEWTFKR